MPLTREAAIDRVDGTFAVLVDGKATRRHLYLGLASAERAVARAAARGDDAHLMLVRLQVVDQDEGVMLR